MSFAIKSIRPDNFIYTYKIAAAGLAAQSALIVFQSIPIYPLSIHLSTIQAATPIIRLFLINFIISAALSSFRQNRRLQRPAPLNYLDLHTTSSANHARFVFPLRGKLFFYIHRFFSSFLPLFFTVEIYRLTLKPLSRFRIVPYPAKSQNS